jgi:hypothetical protein
MSLLVALASAAAAVAAPTETAVCAAVVCCPQTATNHKAIPTLQLAVVINVSKQNHSCSVHCINGLNESSMTHTSFAFSTCCKNSSMQHKRSHVQR